MIRYKDSKGQDVISSNDRAPRNPKAGKSTIITTGDLDQNRKPRKKGEADEKSK